MSAAATGGAAVLAAAAVLVHGHPSSASLRLRRLREPAAPRARPPRRSARLPGGVVPVLAALLGGVVVLGTVAGVLVAVAVGVVAHRRAGSRARAAEATERAGAVTACTVLAAELRAGRPPGRALREAAAFATGRTAHWLAAAAAGERVGGDPAEILAAATGPASAELHQLGACWAVSARTGAGLVVAVDRLADGLRARGDLDAELAAALTAPRATARLLAVLPLLGLGLGLLLGAGPVTFLTTTPVGLACLAAALALDLAGLAVTDRLVQRAARRAGVAL